MMNFIARPHSNSQLQGPRPAALKVSKNSKKMMVKKKNPNPQNPVIVYLISPKIIHVQPEEFMGLVQRLTGNPHQGLRPRLEKINNIVANNSQSCSISSNSGLSRGDEYLMESSQVSQQMQMTETSNNRADYADDVPYGIPTYHRYK